MNDAAMFPQTACVERSGSQTEDLLFDDQQAGPRHATSLGLAALEGLSLATIVVGASGVVLVNRSAEMLLARREGLMRGIGPQGLTAWKARDAMRLRSLIRLALDEESEGTVPISQAHTRQPLLVTVAPLAHSRLVFGERLVLMTARNLAPAQNSKQDQTLKNLYGLTPAEAAVALSLLGGEKTKRIARIRGVSLETVRTQIRRVLEKTESASQRDLMLRIGWVADY